MAFDINTSVPAEWMDPIVDEPDEAYSDEVNEAPAERKGKFDLANAVKVSDTEPFDSEAPAQTPRTPADVMRDMPLQQFGAGLVKGALITPAMAIVKLGARGALEAGLITPEQLKSLGDKEIVLNKAYEENFHPSGAGQFVGEMAIPTGKVKVGAGVVRTVGSMAGKGALYGGMTGAAEDDVTDEDYFNRVASGSVIGAVTAPVIGASVKTAINGIAKLAKKLNLGRKSAPEILDALNMPRHKVEAVRGATEGVQEKILAELRKADAHPVPGYQPTAATKTARLKMAILPAAEEKVIGEEATKYAQRKLGNISALRKAIRTIAGTPAARKAAEADRVDASRPFFNQFDKQVFDGSDELEAFLRTPIGRKAAKRASRLILNKTKGESSGIVSTGHPGGEVPTGLLSSSGKPLMETVEKEPAKYTGAWLDAVREGMKSEINEAATKNIAAKEKNAAITLKDAYTRHLEDLAPDTFGEAMRAYRAKSMPINQMDIGRELEKVLHGTETGVSAKAFTDAIRNSGSLIKRSSGGSRFGKDDIRHILTPEQMKLVYGVKDKLEKEDITKTMTSFGRKAEDVIHPTDKWHINFLNAIFTVAHGVKKASDNMISDRVAKELALEMLYPEKFANVVDKAVKAGKIQQGAKEVASRAGGVSAADILRQHYGKDAKSEKLLKSMANDYGVADSEEDSVLNPPRRLSSEGVPDSLQVQPPRVQVFSADDTEYDRLLRDARAKSQNLHK